MFGKHSFGKLECLHQHAEQHKSLVDFMTGLTCNGVLKVEGQMKGKQQGKHKWSESTHVLLAEAKLQKGAGVINLLHD